MSAGIREARAAVGRGEADAALVVLWNVLEPARIAGDRRALRTIERLALEIVRTGDEGQQREAEGLVEAVREAAAAEPEGVGEVTRVGGEVFPTGYEPEPLGQAGEPAGGGPGVGTIVWFLILLGIVIINILGQARD